MRTLPKVALSACEEDYARPLAQGLDTVQECFALQPIPLFIKMLDDAKAEAVDLQDNLEGTVEIEIGAERMKVHATGAKGGFRWRIENDDFLIMVGSPRRDWTISVRYLSAGLWEHGLEALRARALEALRPYTDKLNHSDWQRVSRADYCFDFHSPAFTEEFKPGLSQAVVIHSSAKAHEAGSFGMWTRGGQGETLTLGSKSGLQVQCYNKTLEIDEVSGKTWLYAIWLAALQGEWVFGDSDKPRDVWRLECRFSGDFLKERNIRTPTQFAAVQSELIAEALYTRRLGVPSGTDDNRWRWPMHPLWSEAVRLRAAPAMLPMGRKVTGRRVALIERAEMAIAGALRSASVLEGGDFDNKRVIDFVSRAQERIERDPRHEKKIQAAQSRYERTEEAR
jgi:hypothetical protein